MRSAIAAALLSCLATASALADGPLFSLWPVSGHGYAWQQAQLDAGLPLEPSVQLPSFFENTPDKQAYVDKLNVDAPILSGWSGRPIALRLNNIAREVDFANPRVSPLNETTWRQSHMCVQRLPDGSLNATPKTCPFSGTAAWSNLGYRSATSLWMRRLQVVIPEPSEFIFRENNEGGVIDFRELYRIERVKVRRSNGTLVNAELATPPSQYVDSTGAPLTADWIVYIDSSNKLQMERWHPASVLDATVDLRAKEWTAQYQGVRPSLCRDAFLALKVAQYRAFFTTFDANLPPAWQGKIRTAGYGNWSDNPQYDAVSPAMYLGWFRDADLTLPGAYAVNLWDAGSGELDNEAVNPLAWREYSICVGNPANAIYAGAQAGRHAVVDPPLYAAFMAHVAWRMQNPAPGRKVVLTEWENNAAKASHLIFSTGTNEPALKQAHIDALTALGRSDLINVTVGDYELEVLHELARIHSHPVLNRFWRNGTTRPLTSPLNTSTATQVFATETTIPGEAATLLYVFTPCDLGGEIAVGPYRVPAKRSGYYLTGQTVEID